MRDFAGLVAVVTGGASGIGEGLVEALLEEQATVVVADVERPVLDEAIARLESRGEVLGIVTDVSRPESVEACAQQVYDTFGACHLLFNNAGVGGGGVAKPWNWTPNDWTWCFGVNVFGVGYCVASFVPRMIAGGEPGWIVNTSSGDGGFQPLADLGVYASAKAAVSCYTECLANALINEGTKLRAGVFYPGGNGLLETRLWNSSRNRPDELAASTLTSISSGTIPSTRRRWWSRACRSPTSSRSATPCCRQSATRSSSSASPPRRAVS